MHGPYLDDNGRTPVNSRHVLYGALVGGPGEDGSYSDDRLDAVRNEVATDYNAGFSSALARFVKDGSGAALADFPKAELRDTEYVVVAKINNQGDRYTEISATIENRTTWPARYSDGLSIRYYVNLSEVFAAGFALSDVVVEFKGCNLCSGKPKISELKKSSTDVAVWKKPVFTEPQYAQSGWDQTLFKGASTTAMRKSELNSRCDAKYKITQRRNTIVLTGAEDLNVGIFSLDGKKLPSLAMVKNSCSSIDMSKFATSGALLQITGKNGSCKKVIYNTNF